jgi:uncharacterized SAM-binding protein YcdF (DUF218 family)
MKRLLQILGATSALAVAVAALTPVPNAALQALTPLERLEPADAVVVLGAGVDEDGNLGDSSLRRTVHGIRLQRRGLAPRLLLFGPSEKQGGISESTIRAELAREMGVPRESILTDDGALTTRAECEHAVALLTPLGARRVLLVTGAHHLPRAQALFTRAGFDVLPAPVPELPPRARMPAQRLYVARGLFMEWIGRTYYRLAGYL